MLRIPCPWCGNRDEVEFRYGGQAQVAHPPEPGALDDAASVEASLQELNDEDGIQLFVAIVDSFDGQDAVAWANETAELSNLGVPDPLLAIATEGDYSWSVDQTFELSDAELQEIAAEMEPELAAGDFDAGVRAAADGMRERAGAGASAIRQHGQTSGRWAILSETSSLKGRLWPSWPGLVPPGLARSRRSFRSVDGGLEDVREVFSGLCSRSTSSISSALLRCSSSSRRMPGSNQPTHSRARGGG